MLLYTSTDAHGKMLYHVRTHPRDSASEIGTYEFKYADLESAAELVNAYLCRTSIAVHIVLHTNNLETVASLGRVNTDNLFDFLQDKMKLLDAIDVEGIEMHPLAVEDLRG